MSKKTPQDELDLAAAIAAAKSRGLKACSNALFVDRDGFSTTSTRAPVACCAEGALGLAREYRHDRHSRVFIGNDSLSPFWDACPDDRGETLGHAFRCAMEES